MMMFSMVAFAEPADVERPGVIVVVRLDVMPRATYFTRLPD
jgi:hypothetical protein